MTVDRDDDAIMLRGGFGPPMPCPYRTGLVWRNEILLPEEDLGAPVHEMLFELGYRRAGMAFFRPVCANCAACRSLRVPVLEFRRSRSQRRIWNRNTDLDVQVEPLRADAEKEDLLFRYLDRRHRGWGEEERGDIAASLFQDPPENGRAVVIRKDGRLLGVGVVSVTPGILSSDYFFFDPEEERRSLGVYSMLWEIEHARREGKRWYHPGFYVADCPAMSYKARLRPLEILERNGSWVPFADGAGS